MKFDAAHSHIEVAKQTNPRDVSFPLALACVTGSLRCA
jgi:hypothetical protein